MQRRRARRGCRYQVGCPGGGATRRERPQPPRLRPPPPRERAKSSTTQSRAGAPRPAPRSAFCARDQRSHRLSGRRCVAHHDGRCPPVGQAFDPAPIRRSQASAMARTRAPLLPQPGFVSAQLHRGIAGSGTFVNVAEWESAHSLGDAFRSPEFQAHVARYPDSTVASPHVFTKVTIAGTMPTTRDLATRRWRKELRRSPRARSGRREM